MIDNKLTFEEHIQSGTNKLTKKVNLLYRISNKIEYDTKEYIYNAIVAPNIVVCNQREIDRLQVIQN